MVSQTANRSEHKTGAIIGLIIALGIDLGWLFLLWPAMTPNPWRWPIAFLTCVMQTAVTTFGAVGFVWLHSKLKVNLWFALPFGAVTGALVGALSLGLAIGVRTWLGTRVGMIVFEQEAAFLNAASNFRLFLEGFGGGFAFGVIGFFVPGMLGALALSLRRRRQERKYATKVVLQRKVGGARPKR